MPVTNAVFAQGASAAATKVLNFATCRVGMAYHSGPKQSVSSEVMSNFAPEGAGAAGLKVFAAGKTTEGLCARDHLTQNDQINQRTDQPPRGYAL